MNDPSPEESRHEGIRLRSDVCAADAAGLREIVEATGVFRPAEIEIAVELVTERLARGEASGYEFVFAERAGRTIGYACYGSIPCTVGSYDLYWIAVSPAEQRRGAAGMLLAEVESRLRRVSARRVYIETSSRADYSAAREFYRRHGYEQQAVLADFYAPRDAKVIFSKSLEHETELSP